MGDTSLLHGGFSPGSAPAPTQRARLVVIAKDGGEGPSYPIEEQLDMGRTEGQIAIAEDRYLSPRHARIWRREGRLILRDLGSTNGVFLRLRGASSESDGPRSMRGGVGGVGGVGGSADSPPASVRGGSGTSDPSADPLTSAHAYSLKDQDLFLVGQQVLRFEVVNDADEGLGPASQHGTLLFGTPAAPRYARLSQRTVEGVTRDVFYIRKAETVLGRESGDIVFTEDPFLSRRHAAIRVQVASSVVGIAASGGLVGTGQRDQREQREAGGAQSHGAADAKRFLLADLGSSNGTFVQLRGEVTLQSGDQFRIGQQLFRIDIA
jgi:pSer/pThr/pTyr-binding forkhead associated (FHA) protein